MKYGFLAVASALALAACGGSADSVDADADGDGEITSEEQTAAFNKSAEQIKPQPGKYKITMEFVSAEGMPEEMQAIMGKGMNQSIERCLTPEEAEKGFGQPPEGEDERCKMEKYTLSGGDLEMAMQCKNKNGDVEMETNAAGKVTPTSQDLTITTKGDAGPLGDAAVTMKVKQERIGDCDE